MLPVVTEVVAVDQGVAFGFEDPADRRCALVNDVDGVGVLIEVGLAPDGSVFLEPMEMRVGPSKRRLESIMEATEEHSARNLKPSPDGRLNFEKGSFEFVSGDGRFGHENYCLT